MKTADYYKRERAHDAQILRDHYTVPYSGTGRLPRINKGTCFALASWKRAKTLAAFKQLEARDLVRIRAVPDDHIDLDDLLGDTYNPDVNPDVKPHVMERERQHQIDRINRDGVWGYIAECWNGHEWVETDSIFGFVGDDFTRSGYDEDLMNGCIEFHENLQHCDKCGQPLPVTH